MKLVRHLIKAKSRFDNSLLIDPGKMAPVERCRTIIDSLGQVDSAKPKPVFTELQELQISNKTDDWEWRETARWVKFEEVVEIGGNRWSKPHVGALTFPSVFELRGLINDCVLCMDMEGSNFEEIIGRFRHYITIVGTTSCCLNLAPDVSPG